jgi:hypothetical protein
MKLRVARVLAIVLLVACGEAPAPEIASIPIDMPPRGVATTELKVGTDSARAITWFHAVAVAPDGRLVTAHPEETLLRVFSPAGAVERTIGRAGSARGQFTAISTLGFVGDTLWAFDPAQRRFSRFSLDGRLIGVLDVPPGDIEPLALLADGMPWGTAAASDEYVAVTLNDDGTPRDTIARWPASPAYWILADPADPQGPRGSRPQPFADHDLIAFARNAPEVLRVTRAATAQGIDAFSVSRLSLDGDTLATRSFTYRAREIPPQLVDSLANAFASDFMRTREGRGATGAQMRVRARESLYVPPAMPAVSAILLGHDGSVWLRRESDGAHVVDWWVLSPDLAPRAVVGLPAAFNALAADSTNVWGLQIESDLTPTLTRYLVTLPS